MTGRGRKRETDREWVRKRLRGRGRELKREKLSLVERDVEGRRRERERNREWVRKRLRRGEKDGETENG